MAAGELQAEYGDEEEEELDPRVKTELESLNQSGADVNCLEKEIDDAREKYQVTFSESFTQLEALKKKCGSSINKARGYFEVKDAARKAQLEALQSARQFQAANGVYLAAKETISLAELRLMDDKAVCLSAAWQEMLNHALNRVTEAETEKTRTEKDHLRKAAIFGDLELSLHSMEKKNKKSIAKSRCYFETKQELEIKLQQLKQTLEDLQQAMHSAKRRYSMSLHQLEVISNNVHERRRDKLILMYPREPGVGAEEVTLTTDLEVPLPSVSSLPDDHTSMSKKIESESNHSHDTDDSDEDCGFEDIQTESVFRARVLNTSLDEEDTSFMDTPPSREGRLRALSKLRAQSMPISIDCCSSKHNSNISTKMSHSDKYDETNIMYSPGVSTAVGENFGQGVNPDRYGNTPPDGDSLKEDALSCHGESDSRVSFSVEETRTDTERDNAAKEQTQLVGSTNGITEQNLSGSAQHSSIMEEKLNTNEAEVKYFNFMKNRDGKVNIHNMIFTKTKPVPLERKIRSYSANNIDKIRPQGLNNPKGNREIFIIEKREY